MTKEELIQFLKDKLRVDVNVIRPLYDDGGPYVTSYFVFRKR